MLNLKHLSDETLLSETKRAVEHERAHLTVVLSHLAEVERRRLFSALKFQSLHDYAMEELGYSFHEADRRISAMRTIRGIPEVEPALASGKLNLTHINIAHSLFKNEKREGREMSVEMKAEVFEAISGLSTREAKKALFDYAPEAPRRPDSIEPIAPNRNLGCFEFTDETLEKVKEIRPILSHEHLSMNELVSQLCDIVMSARKSKTSRKGQENSKAEVSRQVWRRDQNRCTHCGSHHFVQEEHEIPAAMGGEYSIENMKLLCRSCNQRAAIEKFGQDKMDRYLHSRRRE